MIKQINYILLIISCAYFLSTDIYAASNYKIIDLGLQGSDWSYALKINDNGQIVGSGGYYGSNTQYFYLWDKKTGIKLLDFPNSTSIMALNNAGQILGWNSIQSFLWDPNIGIIELGSLGGSHTKAYAMNDRGQVVGYSFTKNGEIHAFLWENGVMTDLGTLIGELGISGTYSIAFGINNEGVIIGESNCYDDMHKGRLIESVKATIWKDGLIQEFDPNFNYKLYTINDDDLTVVSRVPHGQSHNGSSTHLVHCGTKEIIAQLSLLKTNKNGYALSKNSLYFLDYSRKTNEIVELIDIQSIHPWSKIRELTDLNNENWVIGNAANIYSETHGILLVPID